MSSPRVFIDPRTGAINGLNNSGTHGKKGSEKPADTDQCHDITVYSAIGLARSARYGKLRGAQWFSNSGSGRDVEVQAWYQGGISVMDFTDPANPFEIAYFDRGPIDPKMLVLGGDWSAYWYNGYTYGSEIARGLDVFQLTPSKFLTQNEIDAAKTVMVADLNVKNQQKIDWPAKLVVAKAYLDQLSRSQALPASRIAKLQKAIENTEKSHMSKNNMAKLNGLVPSLEKSAATAKTPADATRMHALADVLRHPSA